jgi:periplasmic protein TonB
MTSTNDNQFFVPAWGASLALHGLLVGLAFVVAAQVTPILPEDVFTWDVALVEGTKPDAKPERVESAEAPAQPPVKKVFPSQPKLVAAQSQTVTQIQQTIEPPQPLIEPVQPIEREVAAPQVHEEPVARQIVETVEPTPEPLTEMNKPAPVVTAASSEPVEAQPVSPEPVVALAPAPAPSLERMVSTDPSPSHSVKIDNRWLAESLWRRVAELKRYPNSARMNGQEGKVILKAVIRSDGQLADVSIQRSSGYEALDLAAMEAVKLACPLHMKHAIGKPLIVVSLPIVYSLAN